MSEIGQKEVLGGGGPGRPWEALGGPGSWPKPPDKAAGRTGHSARGIVPKYISANKHRNPSS